MRIDSEFIGAVVSIPSTTSVTVRGRGWEGTAAVAHNILSPVSFAAAIGDFADVPAGSVNVLPPFTDPVVNYGAAGAIAVPTRNATITLDKASAAAMTIVDPTKGVDGLTLTIIATTAAAHTVTNTTGFNGAGTSGDVATFGGAIGDNMVIKALNGQWDIIATRNVTAA